MTRNMGGPASPSGHSRAEPEEVSALRASVPNAIGPWHPISYQPPEGTVVVVFRGNDRFDVSFGPIRDYVERCELGWFEDGRWWESGTGHDMHEPWAVEGGYAPTHWVPLPLPPTSASAIEARRAETQSGSVHESAVAKPDAPEQSA